MMTRFRYDVIGAIAHGYGEHPQAVIRKFYPDARDFESVAMSDCWLFTASRVELPSTVAVANFIEELNA